MAGKKTVGYAHAHFSFGKLGVPAVEFKVDIARQVAESLCWQDCKFLSRLVAFRMKVTSNGQEGFCVRGRMQGHELEEIRLGVNERG